MTVARLAVSFDAALARRVRRAAGKEPISAWLADAAQRKLRAQGLLDTVREWEEEHGEITMDELRAIERKVERARGRSRSRR
jgi:hypothetical protein